MTDLFWFFCLFLVCLIFAAWAAEDETVRDQAERLSHGRAAIRARKRAMNPALKRCAQWTKY